MRYLNGVVVVISKVSRCFRCWGVGGVINIFFERELLNFRVCGVGGAVKMG